jgi:hypothetical protein
MKLGITQQAFVIPAKAGIHGRRYYFIPAILRHVDVSPWIPAFAGMTSQWVEFYRLTIKLEPGCQL